MFHSVTEGAVSDTDKVCPKGPELTTPITPRNSASPNRIVEGCTSEHSDSPPKSRRRKVS